MIEECEVRVRAKQTRDSFPILNRRTSSLFELVHADMWGPYAQENTCSTKYMLTIVEDHSRMTWIYLLPSKDHVGEVLRTYIKMVNTQFHSDIKAYRTNNGTKFVNHTVQHMFAEYGILHQRSCTYTPQHNGVVERRHKILVETARALMFGSGLPLKFWPYSLLTSTWILNKIHSWVLEWSSPYEVLFMRNPTSPCFYLLDV